MNEKEKMEKKKQIADRTKEMLNTHSEEQEIFYKNNPDMLQALKKTANPNNILFADDTFNFDNSKCITDCDGGCCFMTDLVRINPIDVDYMYDSKYGEGKTRKEFVDQYLNVFLGNRSLIPMAIIRMEKFMDIWICPFINFAFKVEVDHVKRDIKNKGVGGICGCGQLKKPAICLLFPLARMTSVKLDETEEEEECFVIADSKCPALKTDKKIVIKDHIGDYIERNKKRMYYIREMEKIVKDVKSFLPHQSNVELLLSNIGYNIYVAEGTIEEKIAFAKKIVKDIKEKFKQFEATLH